MNEQSEREIRERIETTRARMSDTIEQIGDRVNPDHIKSELKAKAREQIHEAKDNVKRKARNTMRDVEHGVSSTGRGIWATIRDNPVPAGMVGVGLAWLAANRRSGAEHRYRDYETYSTGPSVPYRAGYVGTRYDETSTAGAYGATGRIEYGNEDRVGTRPGSEFSTSADSSSTGSAQWTGDGATGESHGIREKAADVVHQATDRLTDAQERVGGWAHEKQHRVGDLAQQARYRAQSAERRVEESFQENPLAAGAMALAIGVAAGLMIPETQREHEMLGRSRDRVLDRAHDATRRAAERMHEAAREAAGESARHAVDEVWPGAEDTESEGFTEPRR